MSILNVPIQIRRGTAAQMPAVMLQGELYFQTDTNKLYAGTGTSVVVVGGGTIAWGTITGVLANQTDLQTALNLLAPLVSPALTGTPTAPTPTAADNSTKIATTAFVNGALPTTLPPSGTAGGDLSGSYPNPSVAKVNGGAVPTSKTVVGTDSSGRIVDASSATLSNNTSGTAANLSGTPALPNGTTATEQAAGSADGKIATDSYVDRAVATETTRAETAEALLAPLVSPAFTGNPTVPTQTALNNSTRAASTAYTDAAVAVEVSRAETAEALLQVASAKDAASGYAGLDGSALLKTAEMPALTGDITTVAGYVATTLKNTGTAGTYTKVTFDAQGREISGTTLSQTDLPLPDGAETAGVSFFFGGIESQDIISITSYASNSSTGWTANQAYAMLFYLGSPITVRNISIWVTAVGGSGTTGASVGIYGRTGTKLVDSGTFNTSTGQATGARTNTITAVTLQPGWYYYVFTVSSATPGFQYFGQNNNNLASILNINGSRVAKGTATTSGALNSPLGSLTNTSATALPWALFEG